MPKSFVGMIVLLLCWSGVSGARAVQHENMPLTYEELPCSFCHLCENPTPKYLCLRACPRTSAASLAMELAQKLGPDLVMLDELESLYLPVPFDHRGHAEMTKMTDGCAACHHYTPEAAEHPACNTCHEVSPKRDDMRKPSLKAAYHRQCLSCHREWSHETGCGTCHPPKVSPGDGVGPLTKDDIIGRMHPPIPEPHTEIYTPRSRPVPGTKIIFRHKEHIHRFGLRCVDCHREESCVRCHEKGRNHEQRVRTLEQHHRPCADCHDVDDKSLCKRCHWKEGEAKPSPFDHADTGWPLSKHHVELGCRICHKRVPFRRLNSDCDTCHSGWNAASFDHSVTAQVLDQNHEDVDCSDCHANRQFDKPPRCNECHDEDEGIVFPAQRPGLVVIPSHRQKNRSSAG